MTIETQTYASADGTRLNGFRAGAVSPRGVVFVCHGLGEHCRRYDHVTAALNAVGITVYGCDLHGHGRSGGKRGHAERWQRYVDDMLALHRAAVDDGLADLPWIQFGHSMGGLVAVHVALQQQKRLAGLALSGPLLGIALKVPPLKALAGNLLSSVLPALTLPNEIDASYISRDPLTVKAYIEDPLVHDRVSTRWFTEMNTALAAAQARAHELQLPIWLAHGLADRLTDPAGSRAFAGRVQGPCETHFLDGCYHEILNEREPERTQVLAILTSWVEKTAAAATAQTKP